SAGEKSASSARAGAADALPRMEASSRSSRIGPCSARNFTMASASRAPTPGSSCSSKGLARLTRTLVDMGASLEKDLHAESRPRVKRGHRLDAGARLLYHRARAQRSLDRSHPVPSARSTGGADAYSHGGLAHRR